jgi:hypothetical protein
LIVTSGKKDGGLDGRMGGVGKRLLERVALHWRSGAVVA